MPLKFIKRMGARLTGRKVNPPATPAHSDQPRPKRPPKKRRPAHRHGQETAPAAAQKPWTVDDFVVAKKEGETRFHDVGLPVEIMHAVADLGFRYCTPIQAEVLPLVGKNLNIAGKAQTGTGKTAAFLVSIFTRFLAEPRTGSQTHGAPRALILAPTRELCLQIVKDARELGRHCPFRTLAIYGGMDYERQKREVARGHVDIIAATPGRLLDFCRQRVINLSRVEVLVIDEADRMLDMGFIPDVRRIIGQTPPKDKRQTLLFSATLDDTVMRLARQWMPDPVTVEVAPDQVAAETVDQIVYAVRAEEKPRALYNLITKRDMTRVLVFCNRRVGTQRVAEGLQRVGVDCELLSGAVEQKKRLRILDAFKSGKINVLVATDVAGRGLHVDDISHVINYDFPYEPEDYVHRIGRTGRVGTHGTAISFACEDESFIIPDIEEYLGETLSCKLPEEDLLEPLPRAQRPRRPAPRDRSPRPSTGNRSGHRSGQRSGQRSGGQGRRRRPGDRPRSGSSRSAR